VPILPPSEASSDAARDRAPRRVLLVDCDCFFVQVARLEDPERLGEVPCLLVGGSASGRGVVTSASYDARDYGVRSAMPTAEALRLCPHATVVPVPGAACRRRSREVVEVLRRLSPVVEAASIDEFYLDLSGTERMLAPETLVESCARIRRTVLEETGVSVSIGGGTNRLVAKLATRRAKPGGVHVVPPGDESAFLAEHDLGDLPGVGPALVESLRRRGLVTVRDALPVERDWLERWIGEGRGGWLYEQIRGVDSRPVGAGDGRKSISSERTFPDDIDDAEELDRRLLGLVVSVAKTLRDKELRARTITVKIRDADFTTRQASHTLPEPVESDGALREVARELLAELRARRRRPARLLGVGVSTLVPRDTPHQLALFDEAGRAETERDREISRVMDDLRDRFGDEAIGPGRLLGGPDDRRRR